MLIRSFVIAATATLGLAVALPAHAADLDNGYRPEKPYAGGPYDDPRYGDIYRVPTPPPRYAAPYPPYRDERYVPPGPPPYAGPPPGSPPYAGPPPRLRYEERYGAACLPREAIREQLASRGWGDLHGVQVDGPVTHVRARRPSGRLFELTLDRCSGQVLQVEPVDHRSADARGWGPGWDYGYRGERYGY